MKKALYGYRADIAGLFWLATGLFLALAMSSYNPMDPSFNSIGSTGLVQNKCGYLGSFIADIFYQMFGHGAWVLVLTAFKNSMAAFQRKDLNVSAWKKWFFVSLTLVTCSSLVELHLPEYGKTFFQGYIASGGILGKTVVQRAEPYLHFFGLFVLLWFSFLMLLTIYTKSPPFVVFLNSLKFLKHSGQGLIFYSQKGVSVCVNGIHTLISVVSGRRWRNPEHSYWDLDQDTEEGKLDLSDDLTITPEEYGSDSVIDEDSKEDLNLLIEEPVSIDWKFPETKLLQAPPYASLQPDEVELAEDAECLRKKLDQFSISGEITRIHYGPIITLFEFKPDDHVKIARITQMEDDLMIALKSESIRIIAPIPGRDVVGIETAHAKRQTVHLKNLLDDPLFWQKDMLLPLVLGRQVNGRPAVVDLRKIPHLMVAGSTGSGKSVFVVSFLLSLLFRHSPETLRLLLVDPKRVDLTLFTGLPHLLAPPVCESKKVITALHWCIREMEKRYRSLAHFQVRDLQSFNEKIKSLKKSELKSYQEELASIDNLEESFYISPQPYICMVLEEFGDLMSGPERNQVENCVVRLAQMARACGMHLILCMQSPRKDVVTGLIKTNIPGRISFKVSSRIDSRIILDEGGAERLLAQGDMLYLGPGQAQPTRFHGPYVREKDLIAVVKFWKKQAGKVSYPILFNEKKASKGGLMPLFPDQEDEKYMEIFNYVSDLKEVSVSHLQRKYGLGYPRAARLIDRLEEEGIIGPARGSKPREVLEQK